MCEHDKSVLGAKHMKGFPLIFFYLGCPLTQGVPCLHGACYTIMWTVLDESE